MSVGLSFLAALLLAALPLFTVGPMIWLAQRSRPGAVHDGPAPRRRTSSPTTAARTRGAPIP